MPSCSRSVPKPMCWPGRRDSPSLHYRGGSVALLSGGCVKTSGARYSALPRDYCLKSHEAIEVSARHATATRRRKHHHPTTDDCRPHLGLGGVAHPGTAAAAVG